MTSETYLDLTFERSAKSGKRPLRPKLLKLTDAAIPRRNRKKTKTKTKDRSLSSVRDRIYDDPAYTDDISHLANPIRPRSYDRRSSNVEMKSENFSAGTLNTAGGGSLNKRSKLAKEFLLYANKHAKAQDYGGGGGDGGVESFGHECSSSSDELTHAEIGKTNSITRRGRSLDRTLLAKSEKRRERSAKQKQNPSLSTCQQGMSQDVPCKTIEKTERKFHNTTWKEPTPDADVASTSNAGSNSKMHIGRRFLRGEIGIKSFNYYLLKEGLKSSKRLVGKQRSSSISTERAALDKKIQSRSEENIYEEIFFKDASASDEENQNETSVILGTGQQHKPQNILLKSIETTPESQGTTDNNVFTNCDLCMEHCSKDNCEYCYASTRLRTDMSEHVTKFGNQSAIRMQYDNKRQRAAAILDNKTISPQADNALSSSIITQEQHTQDNGNNNLPASHILEFQSYNPNNPGVYKIETTPVAITGEYNPILQFQQSSTASSTAVTTPSDRSQAYVQLKSLSQSNRSGGQETAIGGGILMQAGHYYQSNMLPLLATQTRQRIQRFPTTQHQQQQQQQQYILNYKGSTPRIATNFSTNAKSSSSSDSLQQHKFHTVARMDLNVPYNDPFYGGAGGGGDSNSGLVHMHPLIYASNRPLGGSQILLDPYEQTSNMYKSDSRASILSEYSLRSSDTSHRYGRYLHHRSSGGRGEISDSSLGDSLFSCASSAQRRYFGSSESCRFGFECRRCSLDNGAVGVGVGTDVGVSIGIGIGSIGVGPTTGNIGSGSGSGEKCSFSDTCRYDCRNCDCSSTYFSSDFDEVYGSAPIGSIPRKTAAGILPSDNQPLDFERLEEQMDRKQNKYAEDFFKHVNDVKKSIYQSEMQRNSNLTTSSFNKDKSKKQLESNNYNGNGKEQTSDHPLIYTTLPLVKDRNTISQGSVRAVNVKLSDANSLYKPIAAPRTNLNSSKTSPSKTQREKDNADCSALDRLVTTGAIPKTTVQSHSNNPSSDCQTATHKNDIDSSSKGRKSSYQSPTKIENACQIDIDTPPSKTDKTEDNVTRPNKHKSSTNADTSSISAVKRDRYLNVYISTPEALAGTISGTTETVPPTHAKRHHRNSSTKNLGIVSSRRRDTPAAPPPSPATYSDLQELKANLESMQDDTKSPKRAESLESPIIVKNKDESKICVSEVRDSNNVIKTTTTSHREKGNGRKIETGAASHKLLNSGSVGLHETEEDDVFYDARSEDSGGIPATQQPALEAAISTPNHTSNKKGQKNEEDCMLKRIAANRQRHEEKFIIQNVLNEAIRNDDDKNVEDKKIDINESPGILHSKLSKDKAHLVTNEKLIEKQSKRDKNSSKNNNNNKDNDDNAELKTSTTIIKEIATDDKKSKTATITTKVIAVALKPNGENTLAVTTETTTTTIQTTTTKEMATKVAAVKNNDIVLTASTSAARVAAAAAVAIPKSRKHGERRSKSSSSSSSSRQQHQQAKATTTTGNSSNRQATITMMTTISCDTCCQIECDERELKKQQHTKTVSSSSNNNRKWRLKGEDRTHGTLESLSNNKERSNKIKQIETTPKTPTILTTCAVAALLSSKETTTTTPTTTTKPTSTDTQQNNRNLRNEIRNKILATNDANIIETFKNDAATKDVDEKLKTQNSNNEIIIDNIEDLKTINISNDQAPATIETTQTPTPTTISSDTTTTIAETEKDTEAKAENESATDEAERKAVAPKRRSPTTTTTTTTATAATTTTSFAISCCSDIAGVATLSNSIPDCSIPVTLVSEEQSQTDNTKKRRILQRQDYSCLDSSEAQSDDSHLTKDSVTRESQNDELSSSTLDKIDVSGLPLPALPPKKRRTRQRASPLKHHHSRIRHDIELQNGEVTNKPTIVSSTSILNATETTSEVQNLSAFQQYVAKRRESLEASSRSFNEKLEARRKMHYHMGTGSGGVSTTADSSYTGGSGHIPTYLFGENYCSGSKRHSNAPLAREEIFLNKSGWVQVNKRVQNENRNNYRQYPVHPPSSNALDSAEMRNAIRVIQIDDNRRSDMARKALLQHQHSMMVDSSGYAVPKFVVSKVDDFMKSNEARMGKPLESSTIREPPLRPGYRIVDPQLASILNERPGFLPVRNPGDADSPPPITPILSPPPAFQDSSKSKRMERRKPVMSHRQPWPQPLAPMPTIGLSVSSTNNASAVASNSGKGMVFSRSFEYDMRRPKPTDNYVETFSRSFDGNLSERPTTALQRDRSPNFSSLTGNSPNYLTKKDSGGGSSSSLRSRDSSPKYQQARTTAYLNTSVKEAPPAYSIASSTVRHSPRARRERSFERSKNAHSVSVTRSRKSQFNRMGSAGLVGIEKPQPINIMSRFRSFDTTVNQRLNSCDSGARSDLSNDELDNDDDITGSTEFLTVNYHQSLSPIKKQRQRSLTPERNESRSSSGSLRKQRSLTPESRSLTPEDRRKKGSQASLMTSRQNSGSRSNTLERKQCSDDKTSCISRSSSSSSYSGSREREPQGNTTVSTVISNAASNSLSAQHRRSLGRAAKQTEEHRIRRSRSLQLSERSPNHIHNAFASQQHPSSLNHGLPNASIYQQSNNVNPVMIRSSGKSQSLLVENCGVVATTRVRNNDMDKSHSFDFDYNYYNSSGATMTKSHAGGNNQTVPGPGPGPVPVRLDFDKSRSFDDDYRENTSMRSGVVNQSLRYLQAGDHNTTNVRCRKTSPSGVTESRRSPQQTGSPCSNFRNHRQTTSPQNYGTRLCDHELTYDKLRKSLDRSPIMDFCQGVDAVGDYDIPQHLSRNRETINSGGNSELNFMNNDSCIYETPTTTSTSALKQQRSLGHSQTTNESPYATSEVYRQIAHHHGVQQSQQQQQSQHHHHQQKQKQQQQQRESRSGNRGSQNRMDSALKIDENALGTYSFRAHCSVCRISSDLTETITFPLKSKTIDCDRKTQTLKLHSNSRRNKSPWKLLCSGATPVPKIITDRFNSTPIQMATLLTNESSAPLKFPIDSLGLKDTLRPTQTGNYVSQTHIKLTPTTSIKIRNYSPKPWVKIKTETITRDRFDNENTIEVSTPLMTSSFRNYTFKSNSLPDLTIKNGDPYQSSRSMELKTRFALSTSLNDLSLEKSEKGLNFDSKSPNTIAKRPTSYPNLNVLQKLKKTLASLKLDEKSSLTKEPTDTSIQALPSSGTSIKGNGETADLTTDPIVNRNSIAWRISKERRKAHKNRIDKCYNGDSDIQVELNLEEQRDRETVCNSSKSIACRGADGIFNKNRRESDTLNTIQQSLEEDFVTQIRNLQRTFSTKNNEFGEMISDSKTPKCDISKEREPPESLAMRSISQPQSLEAFDLENDCSSIPYNGKGGSNYYPVFAEVIHNFTAIRRHELGLERGMLIEILGKEPGPWWFGRIKKEETNLIQEILDPELGWFPKDFVRIISHPETDAFFLTQFMHSTHSETKISTSIKHKTSIKTESVDRSNVTTIIIESPPTATAVLTTSPLLPLTTDNTILGSSNTLRHSAVKELLTTEINYVNLLTSICEGYLPAMTKRIDIFPPNSIRLIFSNITSIYSFQHHFLLELRKGIEQNQISKVFLKMRKGFLCYSTYCNSYPRALIELETYERVKDACIILENCRESEHLTEFPLAAHLLSPVQRICRYPLHLSEILKMTTDNNDDLQTDQEIKDKLEQLERLEASQVDMPDTRKTVEMALEAMKGVTEAVNEGKRHSETISRHQASFQNFKGPPLHLHSIRFFLQIDATRQKQNLWNSSYTLFLFDNQLIYCKRDIIKRSQFIYKGRIYLDRCRVVNVRDGKMFGQTIKNALRIYCESRDKWYDFCFRSANRKQKFLHTLALERQFGGKSLYVSEMTGFDYALRERGGGTSGAGSAEVSDQSDYEISEIECRGSGSFGGGTIGSGEYLPEIRNGSSGGSGGGGNNSLPESPSRISQIGNINTLPKKTKSRDFLEFQDENQSGSMGRRRLGSWFRRPKSYNSTPNLSPTHKPLIPIPLVTQLKELQLGVISRLGNSKENTVHATEA